MLTIHCNEMIHVNFEQRTITIDPDARELKRLYKTIQNLLDISQNPIRFVHPHTVVHEGVRIRLSPLQFRLFRSLYESDNHKMDEQALRSKVWSEYQAIDLGSMIQMTYRLNRKLKSEQIGYAVRYSTALKTFVARLEKIK